MRSSKRHMCAFILGAHSDLPGSGSETPAAIMSDLLILCLIFGEKLYYLYRFSEASVSSSRNKARVLPISGILLQALK
jgi:hypothetical protein